jgi:proton glutamate symport protein
MIQNKKFKKVRSFLKIKSLTSWIFVGLFIGLVYGAFAPSWVPAIKPFQVLFLHGVKCAIAPLIFSTIVTGIASAGSFKQLGLMGVRTFVYFEVITTLALTIGLLVVNFLRPGVGVHINGVKTEVVSTIASSKISYNWFIEHLLPSNFADAVVRGDVLQIVLFSTIFAFAVLAIGERAKPVLVFCEALADIMFKFVNYIMYLAPLGVCSALASAVAENGWQVIVPLLKLVGTLYFALGLFVFAVLLPVCKIFKIPAVAFAKQVKDPVIWAFATTSSESAYPMALQRLEAFGVPKRVASFVLPMGYSFNLDGSTLYLSLASVFVAQVAGIELSISQQLLIMLTLMLTTKGVAAVPRTSIVVLSGTLTAFGIPLEGVALILGVDAFMDMGRSAINLLGNCLAAAVIARSEGINLSRNQA